MKTKKLYFNYLVLFSDETIKTGVSSQPMHRLQDYYQEASSHNLKVIDFYITSPAYKHVALKTESKFCEFQSLKAMDGHRERFYFCDVLREVNRDMHGSFDIFRIFNEFIFSLDNMWKLEHFNNNLFSMMEAVAAIESLEYLRSEIRDLVQNNIKPKPSYYDWAVNSYRIGCF